MDFTRYWWRILLTVLVVWLVFFMDLEGRSFAGHLRRIARTPETHELFDAIGYKVSSVFRGVRERVGYVYHDYADDGYDDYRPSHR